MSTGLILFIYSIMVYGICNIIVFGSGPFSIFERIREWANNIGEHFGQLFSCMMCLPTNLGIFLSLLNWFFIPIAFTPFNLLFIGYPSLWWLAMILDGAFTSGIVWLIHHVQEYFENKVTMSGEKIYED
jgi:hypothetical protein